MAKNSMRDMDIKNIKKPSMEKKVEFSMRPEIKPFYTPPVETLKKTPENIPAQSYQQVKYKSSYGLWFVASGSVLFLLFALSFLFSNATITLYPKVKNLILNENLSATKDSSGTEGLTFDLVSLPGEEKTTLSGGQEKDVSIKAQGFVLIYNAFSSAPQTLNISTRLEGSNGKTYLTLAKVVVPGMSADGTPGSVKVGIVALEPGEEYNSAPQDFKIIGFKGTAKYSKIYARSLDKISGGIKGKVSQVSDIDKTNASNQLKQTLQVKLLKKVADQIPSGYILFQDAVFLNIDDETYSFENGIMTIDIKATLHGFLFEENQLTKKFAKDMIDKYNGEDIYIPNIRNLNFTLSDKNISFSDAQNINFNISGNAKVVWRVDGESLATEVLGKSKKDLNDILAQHPNISSAEVKIKPFWKLSFPDKLKKIKIIVSYPDKSVN